MTKAFGYLRVSGKGQVDGDGFPRQAAAIKSYAEQHGIKIVRMFKELGVSGSKELLDRAAFVEMMEALHSNGVKTILIEKLDRLARDLMIQETIIGDLKKSGFDLISVMEPDLCSDDPTRKLMRQLMGAVAEYEKSMIVLKLRGARMRTKAKTGSCEGRKAFGHYQGEFEAIERMKVLRVQGLGYDRIAAVLNSDGVPLRTGAKWWGKTINGILSAQVDVAILETIKRCAPNPVPITAIRNEITKTGGPLYDKPNQDAVIQETISKLEQDGSIRREAVVGYSSPYYVLAHST
jgi:DNA invertase Pin-like site-specific DNA recombinase